MTLRDDDWAPDLGGPGMMEPQFPWSAASGPAGDEEALGTATAGPASAAAKRQARGTAKPAGRTPRPVRRGK